MFSCHQVCSTHWQTKLEAGIALKKYIKRKIDKISVQSSVDAVSCKTDMMLYWVWSPGYSEPASLLFIREKNKLLLKVEKKTRDQMEALFFFSCWKWRLVFIDRFSWIYCTTLCSEMSEWSSPRNVALSLIYMPYSIYIIFSRLHFWLQCLDLWISHGSWSSQSTTKRIIKEKLLFSRNACVRNRSSHIQNITSVMANDSG